ncbi:hypothetical protein MMPV_004412 [Pyropia vietnamensis]
MAGHTIAFALPVGRWEVTVPAVSPPSAATTVLLPSSADGHAHFAAAATVPRLGVGGLGDRRRLADPAGGAAARPRRRTPVEAAGLVPTGRRRRGRCPPQGGVCVGWPTGSGGGGVGTPPDPAGAAAADADWGAPATEETTGAAATPTATLTRRTAALAAATVLASAVNRIVYRLQLVPMRGYTFFVAQACAVAYVTVYFSVLAIRRRKGVVAADAPAAARRDHGRTFAIIGALEATAFAVQLYAAGRLPGSFISVLNQAVLPFSMTASAVLLGRRYNAAQVGGAAIVIAGVLLCIAPSAFGLGAASSSKAAAAAAAAAGVGRGGISGAAVAVHAALFASTMALIGVVVVLKERLLKVSGLDVFIVNSYGSLAQCVATAALLPVSVRLAAGGTPVGAYVRAGMAALTGATSPYMPWLTLAYIGANLSFNIAALNLVRCSSAVVALLASLFTVPLTSLVFCLPLPLLVATPFSWWFVGGLAVISTGVLLYNKGGK